MKYLLYISVVVLISSCSKEQIVANSDEPTVPTWEYQEGAVCVDEDIVHEPVDLFVDDVVDETTPMNDSGTITPTDEGEGITDPNNDPDGISGKGGKRIK